MEELKSTVSRQTLKSHLQKINNQFEEVEKRLYAAKRRVDEQQEDINGLSDLQDKLEQYTRKNSLEIHGIPESAYTSAEEVVLKLTDALQVPTSNNQRSANAGDDFFFAHLMTKRFGDL